MKNYSPDTIDKIGNASVYLCEHVSSISKTKLIKLLYLLEEYSARMFHTPFFGIDFEVWQAGPVAKEIFIDLSSDYDILSMLHGYKISSFLDPYVTIQTVNGNPTATYISAKARFKDDEFSDNDIAVMDHVIREYGAETASRLVDFTHRDGTAWYAAAKENDLLDSFKEGTVKSSDIQIDFGYYLTEQEKEKYLDTKATWGAFDKLK